MTTRRTQILTIALFLALTVSGFVFLLGRTGARLDPTAHPYHATVLLPTAVALVPNSDVRAAGVKVGTVRAVGQDARRGGARVRIELDKGFAPLSRDATIIVRTKTLLGENYLSIDPGSRAAGTVRDGGTLPLARADDAVQLDQILSVFDARTRRQLRADLRASGLAVTGRGTDINASIAAAQPATRDLGTVVALLRRQRGEVHRAVAQSGRLLETVGRRRADLRRLVRAGDAAMRAVAARDARLAQTVRTLPGVLVAARRTAARLGSFAGASTPVLDHLTTAAVALNPTVVRLRPTADAATRLLNRVPRLVRAANPLLVALRRLAIAGPPSLQRLDVALGKLNPALTYLAPYARDFTAFFANVGAFNSEYDATGAIARVYPEFNIENTGLISKDLRPLYDRFLDVTGLGKITKVKANQYPAPGTIATPQPTDGRVPAISQNHP